MASVEKKSPTVEMDERSVSLEKNHCCEMKEFYKMKRPFILNESKVDFTFIKQVLKISLDERRLRSKEQKQARAKLSKHTERTRVQLAGCWLELRNPLECRGGQRMRVVRLGSSGRARGKGAEGRGP